MGRMPTPEHGAADRDGSGALRVLGAPRRSLFDAVRPSVLQEAAAKLPGPGGAAVAALQHDGVTGGTTNGVPRDLVVLGGTSFGSPREGGQVGSPREGGQVGSPREGWLVVPDEARALGVASGMAVTRRGRAGVGRTWCVLQAAAVLDGRTLEVAALLPDLPPVRLIAVVVADGRSGTRIATLLQACGLDVQQADDEDAWAVLSALDRACRTAEQGPAAVIAHTERVAR
ncbi:hypothetical protein BH23ACT9_BH23ACT9_12730 [soil metagenome]